MAGKITFEEMQKAVKKLKSREPHTMTEDEIAEYFKQRERTKKIIESGSVYVIVDERGKEHEKQGQTRTNRRNQEIAPGIGIE